jgi:hypothetical protein
MTTVVRNFGHHGVDCSSSSDSTERPLIGAQRPYTCERRVYIVDRSLITGNRAAVPDPLRTSAALRSGHSIVSFDEPVRLEQ